MPQVVRDGGRRRATRAGERGLRHASFQCRAVLLRPDRTAADSTEQSTL